MPGHATASAYVSAVIVLAGITACSIGEWDGASGDRSPIAPREAITDSSGGVFACNADSKSGSAPRIWRLSAAQYAASIEAIVGVPLAGVSNPFSIVTTPGRFLNYAAAGSMPDLAADQLMAASEAAAKAIVPSLRTSLPCLLGAAPDVSCFGDAIARVGKKAFRRPLTAEEVSHYANAMLSATSELGAEGALSLGVEAVLSSPYAVFRLELGGGAPDAKGRVALTPYELATGIAYATTNAPPDVALMDAAERGRLATPDDVRAQVERLLATPAARGVIDGFFKEYLRYGDAVLVFKDPAKVPDYRPASLVEDTALFIQHVYAQRTGFLHELLTSESGFANAETGSTYGLSGLSATKQKVTFPAGQRAGLLTQPSFLAALSNAEETLPILRGRVIRERLLCQDVPRIPVGVVPITPDLGPNATVRDRLAAHAQGTCIECHKLMDPLGLPLEQFDHAGRFRDAEQGKPVDASGAIENVGPSPIRVANPQELASSLANLPQVRKCFSLQAFRYLMGRDEQPTDSCSLKRTDDAFASNEDVVAALSALLSSDAFMYRFPNP